MLLGSPASLNYSTADVKRLVTAGKTPTQWKTPSGGDVVIDDVLMRWDAAAESAEGARP